MHVPETKDTKKNPPKKYSLFPPVLRKIELDPRSWCKEHLEKYLKTEDVENLFNAIKEEPRLLQGDSLDLVSLDYFNELPGFVNHYTVIWTSIAYWRWVYISEYARDEVMETFVAEDAAKLLKRIGIALVPDKKGAYEYNDGLKHNVPDLELTYQNAKKYVERFEKIRESFKKQSNRPKHLNEALELKEKKHDAFKVIRELGEVAEDVFDEFISFLDFDSCFKVTNPTQNTISYISFVHAYICKKCRRGRPGPETLYTLYKKAKKDIIDKD